MSNGLRVDGLTKRIGQKLVLDCLSFDLAPGEVLGLLGANGAGKTTAFLCLSGFVRPDGGTITYDNRALGGDRSRIISLIPETPEAYPMVTVWEHLAFVATAARLPLGWKAEAQATLERFDLVEERDTLGHELSKGTRQKMFIAATVLARARVLLLDEPMIGLDPRGQRELYALIRSLCASGTSVIISTHLMKSAEALCDQLIIMKSGVTVARGTVAEVRREANSDRTLEDVFLEITS